MRKILVITALSLFAMLAKNANASQHLPDTVTIQADKNLKIEWCAHFNHRTDYSKRMELVSEIFISSINSITNEDLNQFDRLKTDFFIKNDTIDLIQITDWTDPKILYYHKENNIQIGISYNVFFKIHDPIMGEVNIFGFDLETINKLDHKSLVQLFRSIIEREDVVVKKWPRRNTEEKHVFNWNPQQSDLKKIASYTSRSHDHINLNGILTANYINNTLVPGVKLSMEFSFGKKGISRNSYDVFINTESIFKKNDDGSYSSKENSWLGLGYSYTNSNKKKMGLNVAYLIDRNGNFYDKNTYRFQFYTSGYKGIRLTPSFYCMDGFKKVYPGFGINISL